MGRRGWAVIIISVLFIGMVVITSLVDKTTEVTDVSAINSGGTWDEELVDEFGNGGQKILLLRVDGVIADTDDNSRSFDASSFIDQLNQAIEDDEIEGVVIRVDSPGGTVIDSAEIYQKILALKVKGKKVGVSMGSTAASGGYYISAPADYIYASPATITGSIGVILTVPNFQKTAEWIGYSETDITSGKMKDIGNPLRPMTPEERQVFQKLVDESYSDFVNVIVEGRKIAKAQVLKLADGRIYSGKQAKQLKLVDKLGNLEDAISEMANLLDTKDYQVVQYNEPFSFQSVFSSFFGTKQTNPVEVLKQALPEFHSEPKLLYMYQ